MNLRHYISILRYPYEFMKFKRFGDNIRLGSGGKISRPDEISMGSNLYIGPYFIISPRNLSFGNNILIGPNFLLEGEDHVFSKPGYTVWETRKEKKIGYNIIENDVWIGGNVTVLKNVKIGEGCIVAAGSVVVKDLPPYSICVGVPCKPLKSRFTDDQLEYHINAIKSNYSLADIVRNREKNNKI